MTLLKRPCYCIYRPCECVKQQHKNHTKTDNSSNRRQSPLLQSMIRGDIFHARAFRQCHSGTPINRIFNYFFRSFHHLPLEFVSSIINRFREFQWGSISELIAGLNGRRSAVMETRANRSNCKRVPRFLWRANKTLMDIPCWMAVRVGLSTRSITWQLYNTEICIQ